MHKSNELVLKLSNFHWTNWAKIKELGQNFKRKKQFWNNKAIKTTTIWQEQQSFWQLRQNKTKYHNRANKTKHQDRTRQYKTSQKDKQYKGARQKLSALRLREDACSMAVMTSQWLCAVARRRLRRFSCLMRLADAWLLRCSRSARIRRNSATPVYNASVIGGRIVW